MWQFLTNSFVYQSDKKCDFMVKIFAVKILKTCGFACSVLFYFFPSSLFGWMGGPAMIEWKDSREPTSLRGSVLLYVHGNHEAR